MTPVQGSLRPYREAVSALGTLTLQNPGDEGISSILLLSEVSHLRPDVRA